MIDIIEIASTIFIGFLTLIMIIGMIYLIYWTIAGILYGMGYLAYWFVDCTKTIWRKIRNVQS